MALSKVILNGTTLMDVTDTTAVATDVASGKYFYGADGVKTAGSASDSWSWMGKNPTKVKNITSAKVFLEDSGFSTWTPSTTSSTIVSASNLPQETLPMSDYDYIIIGRFHTHFEYDPNATEVSMINDYYYASSYVFYGYFNNLDDITDNIITSGTGNQGPGVRYGIFYKSSSGIDSFSVSNYGIYLGNWALMNTSQGGLNTTFVPKTPEISARCGSSYFSTTSASAVDQTASYYEYVMELWKVDTGTSLAGGIDKTIRDMWLNGF